MSVPEQVIWVDAVLESAQRSSVASIHTVIQWLARRTTQKQARCRRGLAPYPDLAVPVRGSRGIAPALPVLDAIANGFDGLDYQIPPTHVIGKEAATRLSKLLYECFDAHLCCSQSVICVAYKDQARQGRMTGQPIGAALGFSATGKGMLLRQCV